jgi:hypothetical protein
MGGRRDLLYGPVRPRRRFGVLDGEPPAPNGGRWRLRIGWGVRHPVAHRHGRCAPSSVVSDVGNKPDTGVPGALMRPGRSRLAAAPSGRVGADRAAMTKNRRNTAHSIRALHQLNANSGER